MANGTRKKVLVGGAIGVAAAAAVLFIGLLSPDSNSIEICSFNIKFVGHYKKKDDVAIVSVLKDCDIALIQELTDPPKDLTFSDGELFAEDPQAKDFFFEMEKLNFDWVLSEEDTGRGEEIHKQGSTTEFFVAFYKPEVVRIDDSLPGGFLAEDRSANPNYDRVPYAFPFKSVKGELDVVLISVHLHPDSSSGDIERRKEEFTAIKQWITDNDDADRDILIVGDTNIQNKEELAAISTMLGMTSLNNEAISTNVAGCKPYDHVFFFPEETTEIDKDFDFQVIDLQETMRPFWDEADEAIDGSFPAGNLRLFEQYFSDHNPIMFKLNIPAKAD